MIYLNNLYWILPEIFLSFSVTCLLGYGVIYSKRGGQFSQSGKVIYISILSLFLALLVSLEVFNAHLDFQGLSSVGVGGLFISNSFVGFSKVVILCSGILILFLCLPYSKEEGQNEFELPLVIILSIIGMLLLVSSRDMIVFYLSIELLSLSFYVLATTNKEGQYSTEAGLKYFLLGALSSALLLLGFAILYGVTGESSFEGLQYYGWHLGGESFGFSVGALFVVLALLFKIGGAPFHVWVPDVYEGSPTIITAFFAIVPKFAIVVSLVGLLFETFFGVFSNLQPFILGSALLSMVVASIGALNQTRMKRLFAYSAVGHGGFLLMGIGVGTYESLQAVLLYLIVYIIMSFVTFPLIFSVYRGAGNYIVEIINLSRNHPILGFTFAITLLSIAGVPPLAGFIGKFFVLSSAMDKGFLIGSVVAVLCSVISGFYYLRLVKQILFKDEDSFILKGLADSANPVVRLDIVRSSIMGLSFFLILSLMFYPNFLLYLTFDTVLFSFL